MANCYLLIANIDMRSGASGSRARRFQETAGDAVYLRFESHSCQSQNMAICYIIFFRSWSLANYYLLTLAGHIKVTPAFTLPALIVVFKSMYIMHGYCAGWLYFCMSISQRSTTCSDQSQKWRNATSHICNRTDDGFLMRYFEVISLPYSGYFSRCWWPSALEHDDDV